MGQRILSHQEFGNGHFCSAKIGTREKVGEEGVVQRCPFLFFVYVFCFFVCLFVFSILQGCIALETRSCMEGIMEKISR